MPPPLYLHVNGIIPMIASTAGDVAGQGTQRLDQYRHRRQQDKHTVTEVLDRFSKEVLPTKKSGDTDKSGIKTLKKSSANYTWPISSPMYWLNIEIPDLSLVNLVQS